MKLKNKIIFLIVCLFYSQYGLAQQIPKWEFGLGVGGAQIPHYRGSDQHEDYLIPLPYFRYNGDKLKVDREGGRYYFFETEETKLDLSLSFAPPVDSDKNTARQGMSDLGTIIEVGPRIQHTIYQTSDKNFRMRIAAPIRAAIDISEGEAFGWVFSPYIQMRYYNGAESAISIGPTWASEGYHNYFYQVESQYATANRPAYDADGGYSGWRITMSTSYRYKDVWFGMFARYDNVGGAVFDDSPLVKDNETLTAGFGIAYVFAESSEKVSVNQH